MSDQEAENLLPGFKGKRYGLCSDGMWHLVLRILPDGRVDTQCAADAFVEQPQPSGSTTPMCQECSALQFVNPKSK